MLLLQRRLQQQQHQLQQQHKDTVQQQQQQQQQHQKQHFSEAPLLEAFPFPFLRPSKAACLLFAPLPSLSEEALLYEPRKLEDCGGGRETAPRVGRGFRSSRPPLLLSVSSDVSSLLLLFETQTRTGASIPYIFLCLPWGPPTKNRLLQTALGVSPAAEAAATAAAAAAMLSPRHGLLWCCLACAHKAGLLLL
ncbi:hypothetical protein Emag_007323 [Eimeria magna]